MFLLDVEFCSSIAETNFLRLWLDEYSLINHFERLTRAENFVEEEKKNVLRRKKNVRENFLYAFVKSDGKNDAEKQSDEKKNHRQNVLKNETKNFVKEFFFRRSKSIYEKK